MRTFEKPGPENTDECLEMARQRATEWGISEVAVATNSGQTALKAAAVLKGMKIIAVTRYAGTKEPFRSEMPEEMRVSLESKGIRVITAGHALSGIERSLRLKYQGLYPLELVADTLRMFSQGTKVCVEISLMAADAGALSGKPLLCIGGSGTGADTALILTPVHQKDFLNLKIHEIICKPR